MMIKRCDHEECATQGDFRAPKSRLANEGYYYFCLDHIRTYNKQWDYFKGMSPDEIVAHQLADITWRRPTWTLKREKAFVSMATEHPFFDKPIGIINMPKAVAAGGFPKPKRNSPECSAIKTLELEYPFSSEVLKKRYLVLVKAHHPDRNAGCKKAEETLKKITVAYKVLSKYIARYF